MFSFHAPAHTDKILPAYLTRRKCKRPMKCFDCSHWFSMKGLLKELLTRVLDYKIS